MIRPFRLMWDSARPWRGPSGKNSLPPCSASSMLVAARSARSRGVGIDDASARRKKSPCLLADRGPSAIRALRTNVCCRRPPTKRKPGCKSAAQRHFETAWPAQRTAVRVGHLRQYAHDCTGPSETASTQSMASIANIVVP